MASLRIVSLCAVSALAFSVSIANAGNLTEALSLAYSNNPTLNAARAGLRATDENLPQAKAGYRPSVSATGSASRSWSTYEYVSGYTKDYDETSAGMGLSVQQVLFRGNRTKNGVKQANAAIKAARASLVSTEQSVLLSVASAYMDILQNQAILELRKQNVAFLEEQARSARDKFSVGEAIRTDVAQAEARLSAAISAVNSAKANLESSQATYQYLVGKKPGKLVAGYSVDKLFPKTLNAVLKKGLANHPSIIAASEQVEVAQLEVKIAEGALLPTVSLTGEAGRSWTNNASISSNLHTAVNSASITGAVSIPIFQSGTSHSKVRQAKESLGQARIQLDLARDQVRSSIVSAWAVLQASIPQITAAQAQVKATREATRGVIEEQKVGQRTLLDVLDSQAELISARIALVQAQRARIVASYSVASTMGVLTAKNLKLKVKYYDPMDHYNQIKDKWIGLRTPDGR